MPIYEVQFHAKRRTDSLGTDEEFFLYPEICPCCAGELTTPEVFLPEIKITLPAVTGSGYTTYRLQFPCCAVCARHIAIARNPLWSLALRLLGFILTFFVTAGIFFYIASNADAAPAGGITAVLSFFVGIVVLLITPRILSVQQSNERYDARTRRAMIAGCSHPLEPVRYMNVSPGGLNRSGPRFIVNTDGVVMVKEDLMETNEYTLGFTNKVYAQHFARVNGVSIRNGSKISRE